MGEAARGHLAEPAREYSLNLVFTLSTGNFVSDVPFKVPSRGHRHPRGDGARSVGSRKSSAGPKRGAGHMRRDAQARKVSVAKGGPRSLPFSWPAPARVNEQPHEHAEKHPDRSTSGAPSRFRDGAARPALP